MADSEDEVYDDVMTKTVQLNDDIYSLFFCIRYNGTYDKLETKDKFVWWCIVIITYLAQFISLSVLSHAYVTQFTGSTDSNSGHSASTESAIHFGFALSALFVVFCYLMSSIKPFIDLLIMCLTHYHPHNELTKGTYHYGILISIFNMALIASTWILSLLIIGFGLYTTIDDPADVLLVSIGNVFILEVDDWIFKWFHNEIILFKRHECSLVMKVHCNQFYFSSNVLRKYMAVMGIIICAWWWLQAADFYQNMTIYNNLASIALGTSYSFCYGLFLFHFLLLCLLPTGIQQILNNIIWMLSCIASILLSCFWYRIFGVLWYKMLFGDESKLEEYYSISARYHTAATVMGSVNVVLLLIVIILEHRKNTIRVRNVLLSDILFCMLHLISIAVILSFRIGGLAEWSEPCIALIPIGVCVFAKYYALQVFNREYTSKVYYKVFKVQI